MSSDLLFVCAYNVCRSPYLSIAFAQRTAVLGEGATVRSRGAKASVGRPICRRAAEALVGSGVPQDEIGAQRSQPLQSIDIERAGLILTASENERSAVALIDPQARARTFSVREFLHLTGEQRMPDDAEFRASTGAERGVLEASAAFAHARRGAVPSPAERGARRFFRKSSAGESPYDIIDVHNGRDSAHRRLFPSLDSLLEDLEERFVRIGRY